MAGTGAIWRDDNLEADAKTASEIIEFDTGATPDALTKSSQSTLTILSGLAFLKKPKGQMNKIQDTFVKGVQWRLVGYVINPKTSGAQNKTKIWGLEAKTVVTTFPLGRFGLRLDDFPDFNVNQNANRGIMMGDIKWTILADSKFKAMFEMDLFFQANSTGLNSPTFVWTGV